MRALLKLAEFKIKSASYRVLDRNQKTVLWLNCEALRLSSRPDASALATYLWVKPVRGYPKYESRVIHRLEDLGLATIESKDLYFKVLQTAGKKPGDYSAKVRLKLSPDMRADEASKAILRFLLGVIKTNETYVRQDIDPEFLHDFRVAIRRTRSALSQISGVFPQDITDQFTADFADLGQLSNELRDLDVYLLDEQRYRAMLPAFLRDDIEPLFELLRQKRVKALQAVIKGLNSEKYSQILEDWERFLNEPSSDSATAPNAGRPVIDLARERIFKRYRRIVKSGKRILTNSEDEMLHALRIECKKLRYLLEFFASLFPAKETNQLIGQLKKLQTNLGDFNDFAPDTSSRGQSGRHTRRRKKQGQRGVCPDLYWLCFAGQ
jgi:CHAD domain-containing protein